MKRFLRSFRQLRWKLTLSYALTAIASFLLVVTLLFGGMLLWLGTHTSTVVLNNLNTQAVQAAPYLAATARDPALLTTWLQATAASDASQAATSDPFHYRPIFLAIVNLQGTVLASVGTQSLVAGMPLQTQINAQNAAQLFAVLKDSQGTTSAAGADSAGTLVAITPVMEHGIVQGALAMKIMQPDTRVLFLWLFDVVFLTGIAATILDAISGTIFGYFIARGLTRRLRKLTGAADRWSRGDFAARAVDTSQDELGQVAHQFNQMAEQLQNLLETRRQLATLEERNRLARDLHDSVKQQVFAISMQVASTRILLRRDINAAEEHLVKTENLVKQAQQELTTLIRELRPVALEGKGLIVALRELLPQWSQHSEIVANLQVEGSSTLALSVEEALFRVAQEALSNIARHSKATLVQLTLSMTGTTITLTIQDNGQGFDPVRLEQRGVGLLSMQERVKALGGELRVESTPGLGTRIIARCTRAGVGEHEASGEQAHVEKRETVHGKSAP